MKCPYCNNDMKNGFVRALGHTLVYHEENPEHISAGLRARIIRCMHRH